MRKTERGELGDMSRLSLMMIIAFAVLTTWHYFYEIPKTQQQVKDNAVSQKLQKDIANDQSSNQEKLIEENLSKPSSAKSHVAAKLISIKTNKIIGSWNINGATLSDVILHDYRADVDNEEPIAVLSSAPDKRYYLSVGWISDDIQLLPNATTKWKYKTIHDSKGPCTEEHATLCPGSVLSMHWNNGKQTFFVIMTVLDDYMLQIEQHVQHHSTGTVAISPYIRLKRNNVNLDSDTVSHQGLVALVKGSFKEFSYKEIKKNHILSYQEDNGGWFGVSDKYWLTAILPTAQTDNVNASRNAIVPHNVNMRYLKDEHNGYNNIQNEMIYKSRKISEDEPHFNITNMVFIGPKDIKVLDAYSKKYDIKLFDRAIDFGIMYFITKPILLFLRFIYGFVGNYGIAIVILTIAVRSVLWPLSKKSYLSMAKIKVLQPQMMAIREQYKDDKASMNRAIMELYRSAKVNPLSGIMPILLQIPIFFSLYKVLYVSIEMRHSPFFFWIQDLSVPDHTSIFNLFGLLPFVVPAFLRIGVLPILMGLTMWLQQKNTTNLQNPAQAKMLLWMPVIFTFLFANFASGLMIYWIVSNTFSIVQQYILARHEKR